MNPLVPVDSFDPTTESVAKGGTTWSGDVNTTEPATRFSDDAPEKSSEHGLRSATSCSWCSSEHGELNVSHVSLVDPVAIDINTMPRLSVRDGLVVSSRPFATWNPNHADESRSAGVMSTLKQLE